VLQSERLRQPAAAEAAGRDAWPRDAPSGDRRAARPSGAPPASAGQRPARDGDASRLLSDRRGARRPRSQRAPDATSEISCGVAVSKPTTSSIPGSAGSAIENSAPARDVLGLTGPPGFEPGPARLELAVLPLHHGPRKSLRQESNPHFGRTKGACLPLTPRRRMETVGVEPTSSSLQARRSSS
jgi:hypothetical protein